MATYFISSASGAAGTNTGASWANAFKTLDACLAKPLATGDLVWVGDDHSETVALAAAKTLTFPSAGPPNTYIYCVDHTKSAPGAGDLRTTASITYTGAFGVTFSGSYAYMYGINWTIGSGASAGVVLQFNNNSASGVLENCTFTIATTGSGNSIIPGSTHIFIGCTFKFSANNQNFVLAYPLYYYNCTFNGQGFTSTTFLASQQGAIVTFEDCDFALMGATTFMTQGQQDIQVFKRCKYSSSATLVPVQGNSPWSKKVELIQCDSGGLLSRNERYHANGNSIVSTVVARVGGAQDSTTPVSHWCKTTASAAWQCLPFHAFPIAIWNTVSGSAVNVTVEFIADPRAAEFAAIPKNDEFWIEVEYLGTASSTRGSIFKGTKAGALDTGTAQTASTADWTAGSVPARANSTAYALGAAIKLASNAGRVFFCSVAGTSSGSEPVGYASAVDGGSVTDGGATFKAGWRFKQTLNITPVAAGLFYVQPKLAKASLLGGIYIDPLVTLS